MIVLVYDEKTREQRSMNPTLRHGEWVEASSRSPLGTRITLAVVLSKDCQLYPGNGIVEGARRPWAHHTNDRNLIRTAPHSLGAARHSRLVPS